MDPTLSPTQKSWLKKLTVALQHKPKDRHELRELLQLAETKNILDPDALAMMEGVLQVSEMQVRDIMIPRSQMIVIEETMSLKEFLPFVIESHHSRFPVVNTAKNEVLGTLLAKDLLACALDDQPFHIVDLLRPAVIVPESKRLDVLLKEFRNKRNHMAIVVDEYGQLSGLVTIEDVLEQIVGEIEDEYDHDDDDLIKQVKKNKFTVKAQTPIEEFNDYFHSNCNTADTDTIGGLVTQQFGYLPRRGEKIKLETLTIKVLHADNRRIRLLEITTPLTT